MIRINIHPRVNSFTRGEHEAIHVNPNSLVLNVVHWLDRAIGILDRDFDVLAIPKTILFTRTESGPVYLDPYKSWAQNGVVEGTVVYRSRPSCRQGLHAESA
jgi:hypothetical protein